MTTKILNLYAGIGGNRKLWNGDIEVTAIEINPKIAKIYQDFFPQDKVIITDAHQYLLEHYQEFDFIWSSPPCVTHSRTNYFLKSRKIRFIDGKLFEEIFLLKTYFKGKWVVENVIPYYDIVLNPQIIGRHIFWANFLIPLIKQPNNEIGKMCGRNQTAHKKNKEERNCVNSKLALHIFECAFKIKQFQIHQI